MEDPLFNGRVKLSSKEIPKLTSGKCILEQLHTLSDDGKKITNQLYGKEEVLSFFEKLFPEIVQSNGITKEPSKKAKAMWLAKGNILKIKLDEDKTMSIEDNQGKANVYIGGPAALFAGFIEAKAKQEAGQNSTNSPFQNTPRIAYFHCGDRGLSNWKGSASYFHVRDCVPVFYWPDNTGTFVFLNTLKQGLQKKLLPKYYYNEVYTNPDFNMLRLSYKGVLNDFANTVPLFAQNTYYMMRDVGLRMSPTIRLIPPLNSVKESIAYVTLEHAAMSRVIFDKYCDNVDRPLLLNSSELTRALHIELTPGEKGKQSFIALKKYNQEYVPFRELSDDERKSRGYSDKVLQALEFPIDGYLPPYLGDVLEEEIRKSNGEVKDTRMITQLLVKPKNKNDLIVSQVVLKDTKTGAEEKVPINELFLSLGPSARQVRIESPNYSVLQHTKDVLKNMVTSEGANKQVYPPTLSSLIRHIVNNVEGVFTSGNILPKTMWASGSSSVLLIKVDPAKVSTEKLRKFRDHLDKHNRHFVRLGEKHVVTENGKEHIYFATQVVGGGAFPSHYVHPETALNIIKCNAVAIYGLDEDGIEYDIVQVRSCARGVTGQNAFRFTAPFANMVQMYGIGGIGMTTMAPNGLMMQALMKTRKLVAAGIISEAEYHQRLKTGDFGEIPHYGPNIFNRNYAQFTDNAGEPMKLPTTIRRKLGIDSTLSGIEYCTIFGAASAVIGSSILFGRKARGWAKYSLPKFLRYHFGKPIKNFLQ